MLIIGFNWQVIVHFFLIIIKPDMLATKDNSC